MKVLWASNAPWCNTGYGVQTNSVVRRLMNHPDIDEIGIFANYGLQSAAIRYPIGAGTGHKPKSITVFPTRSDVYGNDVIRDHARTFGADVVISLYDIWVLNEQWWTSDFKWVPYMPIDMEPLSPMLRDRMVRTRPIFMSKFGCMTAQGVNIDGDYIPHGIESKMFKPYKNPKDKAEARRRLGFPEDCYLVGTVAANKGYPPRKGWPQMFEAFAEFKKTHSDAIFYCHTIFTEEYQGLNLLNMAEDYGIKDSVWFADPYKQYLGMGPETMNAIYNSMDVFFLASMGEGFGVPIIEAQACGVPVIVSGNTACSELCGAGWTIDQIGKVYTGIRSWYSEPNPSHAAWCLGQAYNTSDNQTLKDKARIFAMSYDQDLLYDKYWEPYIHKLDRSLEASKASVIQVD